MKPKEEQGLYTPGLTPIWPEDVGTMAFSPRGSTVGEGRRVVMTEAVTILLKPRSHSIRKVNLASHSKELEKNIANDLLRDI